MLAGVHGWAVAAADAAGAPERLFKTEGELHVVAAGWCGANITAWHDAQPLAGEPQRA